jgi:hypothetical protein
VRDQLIAPAERQEKAQTWDQVVQYIRHKESRVREEIQHIAGDEFRLVSQSTPGPALHSRDNFVLSCCLMWSLERSTDMDPQNYFQPQVVGRRILGTLNGKFLLDFRSVICMHLQDFCPGIHKFLMDPAVLMVPESGSCFSFYSFYKVKFFVG